MIWLVALFFIYIISLRKKDYDALSKDTTTALRGILAICIILHHVTSWFPFSVFFAVIGTELSALFFFLSGYSLLLSQKKNSRYTVKIITGKIPALLLEYGFIYLLTVAFLILFQKNSLKDILASLLSLRQGLTTVPFTWFIFSILIFYLAFFVSFNHFNVKVGLTILFFLTLVYSVFFRLMAFPDYWYLSVWAFPVGALLAAFKETIDKKTENRYIPVLIISYIISVGLTCLVKILPESLALPTEMLMNVSWTLTVIILLKKINIVSPITTFLGTISLDIYLGHALVNLVTRSFMDSSKIYWAVAQLILSVLFGWLLHSLFNRINKLIWK